MITTYLTQSEIEAFTSVEDKELNELFQYARKATGNCILMQSGEVITKRLFRSDKVTMYYGVYWTRSEQDREFIITNFYGGESSIRTVVPKEVLMHYLVGLLTGVEYGGEK